jgi:hypothetical protein
MFFKVEWSEPDVLDLIMRSSEKRRNPRYMATYFTSSNHLVIFRGMKEHELMEAVEWLSSLKEPKEGERVMLAALLREIV